MAITHVVVNANTVSFHVDHTGVPVEIRMSYFPWWTATGAQGPWQLDPDELVVVPTSHDVMLTASPKRVDRVSLVISGLAVLATIGLAVWDRRNRRANQSLATRDVASEGEPAKLQTTR